MNDELPLPDPTVHEDGDWRIEYYTATQLREYAKKAVKAECEAIIQLMPGGYSVDPQWVCDAIRARGNV